MHHEVTAIEKILANIFLLFPTKLSRLRKNKHDVAFTAGQFKCCTALGNVVLFVNSYIIVRYVQLEIGCPLLQQLHWSEISQRQHVNPTRLYEQFQKCLNIIGNTVIPKRLITKWHMVTPG